MGCEGFSENQYAMTKELFDAAERNGVNYFDLYVSAPKVRAAVGEAMLGRRGKFQRRCGNIMLCWNTMPVNVCSAGLASRAVPSRRRLWKSLNARRKFLGNSGDFDFVALYAEV